MARAKSAGAVILGFLIIAVLSTLTDSVLEANDAIPRGALPLNGSELMLAGILGYRAFYSLIGCYVTARLAPVSPMKHALALGLVGAIFSIVGAIAMSGKAPLWYDVVLVAMALPVAWLGGTLQQVSVGSGHK